MKFRSLKGKYVASLALLFLIVAGTSLKANFAVTNTVANFNITDNGTKFSFDIYSLSTGKSEIRMGSSSFYIRFVAGTFANPELTFVNPKYTSGSVSNSYNEMRHFIHSSGRVYVQLYYSGGTGDILSDEEGITGFGEKIASVSMDIVNYNLPDLRWDNVNTGVVNTLNQTAVSTNNGSFNGTLPVELSTFTASASGNSVKLNWSTNSEENNSGFEVQRRSENGDWTRAGFVSGSGNSSEMKSYTFSDRNLQRGEYSYRLKQIDFNGYYEFHELTGNVIIGGPGSFALHQNYPNPFNPSTVIAFELPYDAKVSLRVYDISGRLISTLIDNQFRTADYYSVSFNATSMSSGVYFYELRTDKDVRTAKMTLVK